MYIGVLLSFTKEYLYLLFYIEIPIEYYIQIKHIDIKFNWLV